MEENCGDDKESKYLEVIRQLNEAVHQLKSALDEKDNLIKSLQKEVLELKKEAVDEIGLLECEENQKMDSQPLDLIDEAKESQNKKMKKEIAQVNQPNYNSDDYFGMAVAKGLKNPLVLTKILRNVRTMDLLNNCRLVNRDWRDLSTDVLLKRKSFRVALINDGSQFFSAQKNTEYWEKDVPEKSLCEFNTLMTTSTKFPCANFAFNGNLKMDDAQAFLSKFGSNIKRLQLIGKNDLKFIRKLFVEQVPHLEHLQLHNVKTKGELFSKKSPATKLSSLISLELCDYYSSSSLIKGIVDAAPNLQECNGFWSMSEIELLVPRLHILKGLYLKPKARNLDALEKLMKMNLQLKYFNINYNNLPEEDDVETYKEILTRYDKINSKILVSSQKTLEEIKLTPHTDLDNLIEWPQMLNVVKLTMSGNKNGYLNFPTFKISVKFPKLHTLCITDNWESDDFVTEDFVKSCDLFNDVASSVKVLMFDGWYENTLLHSSKTFPNVHELSLEFIFDFLSIAPAIWNMKNLKSLKLTFSESTTTEIDAGFTGMEKATCRFLRNPAGAKMTALDAEKFRVNPSILDLKGLKELHLPDGFQQEPDELDSVDDEDDNEKESNKPSFVSLKYAFNLMPQLRVFS